MLLLAGTTHAQQPLPPAAIPYSNLNPQATPVPVIAPPHALPNVAAAPLMPPAAGRPTEPESPILRAVMLQPAPGFKPENQKSNTDLLEPPGEERLIQLQSEKQLFETWQQQAKDQGNSELVFPQAPILTRAPYLGRAWPERALYVEPNYVNYQRLFFEEINSERYGWDLGPFSVVTTTAAFFKDVLLYPYHTGTDICRRFDSNAGYCLPGDPVPYMLYPPALSITGAFLEAASVATLLAVFP